MIDHATFVIKEHRRVNVLPKSLKVIYEDGVFKPPSHQVSQQESLLHSVEILDDRLTHAEKLALSNLITSLRADWPCAKFTLFGSKVKGMADEESDLDLLVILTCPVDDCSPSCPLSLLPHSASALLMKAVTSTVSFFKDGR